MRRLIAGAALGLVALAGAVPGAEGHSSGHDLSWEGRPDEPKLKEGDSVFGLDFLRLKIATNDPVTGWKIEMVHEATGAASFCQGGATDDNFPAFDCNWDTRHAGDMSALAPGQGLSGASASANGTYLVTGRVWAKSCGLLGTSCGTGEEHATPPFKVTVTNPLSKPATPTQGFNSVARTVEVRWAANPEPDIAKYVVQERVDDGAWVDHDNGRNLEYVRPGEPGSYQYRVVAQRPQSPAVTSEATPALAVAPPPPAPAPEAPPPDLGPEPGVSLPGTESSTSTPGTASKAKAPAKPRPKPTETARGAGGSSLFARPSATSVKPSSPTTRPRTTVTTIDDGYEEALVYPTTAPPLVPVEMPGGEEIAVPRTYQERRPVEPRALLIPLAGGLAVFVFAMQVTFMVRRRPSLVTADDFADWA